MVGTVVAEVAGEAVGEGGLTGSSSVVLDEKEAFHRCSGFEFQWHSITTIIIRKINYLIFHNYQQIGVFRGLGDAEHAEVQRGGDAEERSGDVGGGICVFALLERGFRFLGGRVTGRKRGAERWKRVGVDWGEWDSGGRGVTRSGDVYFGGKAEGWGGLGGIGDSGGEWWHA